MFGWFDMIALIILNDLISDNKILPVDAELYTLKSHRMQEGFKFTTSKI